MSFKSVVENIKENGLKYITPKRIYVFLRSKIRWITGGYRLPEKHAIAFAEIVTYKSLTCSDCVRLGKCRKCKCPINELFTSMNTGCSEGKFPEFQVKIDWKQVWLELKKRKFKEAWGEIKKREHWSKKWEKYKEEEGINLIAIYT